MSPVLRRAWRAITSNGADTRPGSRDPQLYGRTYAIPFEDVWQAALSLVTSRLAGWSVVDADDGLGWIVASAEGRFIRFPGTIVLRIGLDENGQTRVDVEAKTAGWLDFGVNARRMDACLRSLDRLLENGHGRSDRRADERAAAADSEPTR